MLTCFYSGAVMIDKIYFLGNLRKALDSGMSAVF